MEVESIEKIDRSDSMGFQIEYILHMPNGQTLSILTPKTDWAGQEFNPQITEDDIAYLEMATENRRVDGEFIEFHDIMEKIKGAKTPSEFYPHGIEEAQERINKASQANKDMQEFIDRIQTTIKKDYNRIADEVMNLMKQGIHVDPDLVRKMGKIRELYEEIK